MAFYCLSISERWGVKFAGPAKIIPLNYLPSSNVIHSGQQFETEALWMSMPGRAEQGGVKEKVQVGVASQ